MKNGFMILTWVMACAFTLALKASAEESNMEKTQNTMNKAGDTIKEGYRDTKDKACEMVNGKLHCVGKKIKNKAETLKDKTDTKASEVKNKVD